MGSSYRELHYAQRPAKNVERKMIVESLGGLDRLHKPEDLRYIGLGSIYFTDFLLVHRQLAITKMLSIEKDSAVHHRNRFELNRPFNGVEVRHGRASQVLPDLDWTVPSICWLDYDGHLDDEILGDVETVVGSAKALTVLVLSVSVDPGAVQGDPKETTQRVDDLKRRIGPERMPRAVANDAHLGGWKLADESYKLLNGAIERALRARNSSVVAGTRSTRAPATRAVEPDDRLTWTQFLHFRYEDGAKMLTIGGILHEARHMSAVDDCKLLDKQWARSGPDAFVIDIPKLTTREVLLLDRLLPGELPPDDFIDGIPRKESLAYASVYRHLPAFVDAVL